MSHELILTHDPLLRQCPWAKPGEKHDVFFIEPDHPDGGWWYVNCTCLADHGPWESKEIAIQKWNSWQPLPVKIVQAGDGYDPTSEWTCSGCKDARWWEDEGPEKHGVKFCTACGAPVSEFVPYKREFGEEEESAGTES